MKSAKLCERYQSSNYGASCGQRCQNDWLFFLMFACMLDTVAPLLGHCTFGIDYKGKLSRCLWSLMAFSNRLLVKRLTFLHKALLPRSFQISFIQLYGALVRPCVEYGMWTCSPFLVLDVRRLVPGLHHLPFEKRLKLLDLHSLQLRRLWADLIITFKTFTVLLEVEPNLLFPPSTHLGTPE